MTERKPPGLDVETWVDRQIREAAARGDLDDLPGAGRPLPGRGVPDDEDWWLKQFLRREDLGADALLPASLRLRKQVEGLRGTVVKLRSEAAVRAAVAAPVAGTARTRRRQWWRLGRAPEDPT